MSIAKNRKDKCVHTEHCCAIHGCKYGHHDCPVETMKKAQSYPCEQCDEDSGNDGYSIYIDRITDLERRNAELTRSLVASHKTFCTEENCRLDGGEEHTIAFGEITRTKENSNE